MDLLEDRKKDDDMIFRAHVERTLRHHAQKMEQGFASEYAGFKTDAFKDRAYVVDDKSLVFKSAGVLRMADMKRLRKPGTYKNNGPKFRRENRVDAYNRIIMGHFNGIMGDLSYGLTEQIRAELKAELDNKKI